jgi:O-antigen/teichoic acid export membrane protein
VNSGSVAQRVAASTAVQALAKAIVFPLSFVAVSLSTRYLGQERFGELTTITVYLGLLSVVTEWGLPAWTVRALAREDDEGQQKLAGAMLGLRLLIAGAGTVMAVGVSLVLPYPMIVRAGIAVGAVAVLATTAASAIGPILQTKLRMGYAALADVARTVVYVAAILIVIGLSWGVLGFVGANIIGAVAALAIIYVGAQKLLRITLRVDRRVWRAALASSLALGAAMFVHTIYFRADTVLLSVLQTQEDVGIYGFAYRFYETLLVVPTLFTMSVLPVVARDYVTPGADFRRALQRSFDFLVLASLPLAVGGIILAPRLTELLAGAEFANSVLPLRILLAGLVFSFLAALVGTLLIAADRQTTALKLSLGILCVNVVLNVILIPKYSYNAAAALTTGSEALVVLIGFVIVWRAYGFRPSLRTAAFGSAAAVVMGLVVYALDSLPLVVPLIIGTAVYGLALLATGTVSRELLAELLSRPRFG